MIDLGLNFGFLAVQILNILVIAAWIGLSIYCLLQLRKLTLSATAKALWTLIVVLVPVVGSVAFLIVKPSEG